MRTAGLESTHNWPRRVYNTIQTDSIDCDSLLLLSIVFLISSFKEQILFKYDLYCLAYIFKDFGFTHLNESAGLFALIEQCLELQVNNQVVLGTKFSFDFYSMLVVYTVLVQSVGCILGILYLTLYCISEC